MKRHITPSPGHERTSWPTRLGLLFAIAVSVAIGALAATQSPAQALQPTTRGHQDRLGPMNHAPPPRTRVRRPAVSYDQLVLSQKPIMYLPMDSPSTGRQDDASGHGHAGTYRPGVSYPALTRMPNGDAVACFDGRSQYLEVPNSPDLSVTKTGALTVSVWIRPDTLQFPAQEGTGYVNFLGKGEYAHVNQLEYELRMYSRTNSERPVRPNRLSAYCFNLPGGLGSGSYFQDPVLAGEWVMVTEVINTRVTTPSAPTGYVTIFKNGERRQTVALTQYHVVPAHGTAPFRVGSVELDSCFLGPIGKVAVFDYELTPAQVAAEYAAMTR